MRIKLSDFIAPAFYEVHHEIKNDEYSEYWLKGGRGSTKSTFISGEVIQGIIDDPDANAVVFRRYQNELRDTVLGQFEWSMAKLGVAHLFTVQVSPMQIIYNETGQKIVFKSADNPRKMKSIKLGKGYIKYAWFEEVDQFNGMEEIRNIIQSLFRGEGEDRVSFYSFNPPKSARSWVNQEIKIPKTGKRVHHSDYRSVPVGWLGPNFFAEADHLKEVNENAYNHEYLGHEVGTGLEVFNNVSIREITQAEIDIFSNIRQGVDFGYAVDPVVYIKMNYDKTRKRLYMYDEFSGVKISNASLYRAIQGKLHGVTIADSAEPKSIAELKGLGMRIKGAKKGPDSIDFGMKFLSEDIEEIIIDPRRCGRAAKEFTNYALETDRHGEVRSSYPDKDNHVIDAVRYGLEGDMGKQSGWLY